MAIRDDFAAGEVLAAADLNDTFASKLPYSYGTATPSTTVEGFVWFDENFTPPIAKVWNGTAFVAFSQGPADFSNAASGTYTDSGVDYKYLTFTASGTLTVTRAGFADVLVIGGGGAGGGVGGGGAGGHLYVQSAYLPTGSLTITVGAGGAATGYVGTASRLDSYVSPGGGAGANPTNALLGPVGGFPGMPGGSGGGGNPASGGLGVGSGGAGISGLGNSGGTGGGTLGSPSGGGGGGGAGAAGSNGTAGGGGNGGAGTANSVTGSSVTRCGGGGGRGTVTQGSGGSGGGGASGSTTGTSGTANTGGGGGGGNPNGATGGSGIVIVRVKV